MGENKIPQDASPPSEDSHAVSMPVVSRVPSTASKSHDLENDLKRTATSTTVNNEYPTGLKLALVLASAFICMFLTSLDRLILVTAIPKITDQFHSVTQIGWYGSAYLLLQCSCLLLFGKIYTFFSVKKTFLSALFLFEVGSTVCGSAPSSIAFIIGRAISGMGAAGLQSGSILIIVQSVPLHKRPAYQGLFGAIFGISSIVGPLIGGALTSKASWRWCFYINLPLGAAAAVAVFFLLTLSDHLNAELLLKEKLVQLDFPGTMMMVPAMVCLVLALQWGGTAYQWNSARIITLLTVGGVLMVGFILVQSLLPKTATIAPRIVKQRTIIAAACTSFCNGAQVMIFAYYMPIWFQGIQGVSALESGIRFLPTMLSMVVSMIASGILIRKVGYYTPFLLFGVCLMSVGAGLLYTLQVDTPKAKWIGYQIVWGLGAGFSFQAPNLAAQTVLDKKDVPIGVSLMMFTQLLGSTVFVSVAQNVLSNQLLKRLASVPGLEPKEILNTGATSLVDLPATIKPAVLVGFNEALRHIFLIGVILACMSVVAALFFEWRSLKQDVSLQIDKEQTRNTV